MRKSELLKRIEVLEEKVRLLESALELHEMTKHPVPVVPYWPFLTQHPWDPANLLLPSLPTIMPLDGSFTWTPDNGDATFGYPQHTGDHIFLKGGWSTGTAVQ